MNSIYRSPQGEAEIIRRYDQSVANFPRALEHKTVPTRYGDTHVLLSGPIGAPPLVILQGGNFFSPMSLAWFEPLFDLFRIYAPDTVGHPGRSAQTRLSPNDNSYGYWLQDVLDSLALDQAAIIGPSYGAGIVLRGAVVAPERISKAALMVPSGLVGMPVGPLMLKIVLPMMLYRLTHRRQFLEQSVLPMFTEPPYPDWVEATGAVYDHVRVEPQMPRNVTVEELASFHAPVLVVAAEKDVFFPGSQVIARARQVIPNLVDTVLLPGSGHVAPRRLLPEINAHLQHFLCA